MTQHPICIYAGATAIAMSNIGWLVPPAGAIWGCISGIVVFLFSRIYIHIMEKKTKK
jgi:hypothetical protein